MSRTLITAFIVAFFALAILWSIPAAAEVFQAGNTFYNYYGPIAMDGTSAQLYVCPRPVPAYVGRTYIPYEPLQPHEFLYCHSRTYAGCNPSGGATVTHVRYGWRPQPFMRLCYPCGRMFTDFLNLGCH